MKPILINDRSHEPKDKILSKTEFVNKMSKELKYKYHNIFKVLRYDDNTLRTDINNILTKYSTQKKLGVNPKFIEKDILNIARQKSNNMNINQLNKQKSQSHIPINPVNNIKTKQLPAIKKTNKSTMINNNNNNIISNISSNISDNNLNNIINDFSNNNIPTSENENNRYSSSIPKDNQSIKNYIINEDTNLNKLIQSEQLKQGVPFTNNDFLNQDINLTEFQKNQKEKKIEEQKYRDELKKQIQNNKKINSREEETNEEKNNVEDDSNGFFFGKMSYEQKKYLERKNKIKEDVLKYQNLQRSNKRNQSFENKINQKYEPPQKITNEDLIQMKIINRTLSQEKAADNLLKILQEKKNNVINNDNKDVYRENQLKKTQVECEKADKNRQIQIEKMKKLLDYSIDSRIKRKEEEKNKDKIYKEMVDKDYALYLQEEKEKKQKKIEQKEQYRKMIEEQIKEKKQKDLEEESSISDIQKKFKDLTAIDI